MPDTVKIPAVLIVGPPGSGKTPLGRAAEERGLWGRRALHFDFGEALREASAGRHPGAGLTEAELGVVRKSLDTGALLEDDGFPIARKLLHAFVGGRMAGTGALLLLNGMPRHLGQAEALAGDVDVRCVLHLDCPPGAGLERIRGNAGGDREGRPDDAPGSVGRRREIFRERTVPLIDHYRSRGARVLRVPVGAETSAEEMLDRLESAPPPFPEI